MIIGIDIDDTISDTYEVMINYAQEYQINKFKREPILKKVVAIHIFILIICLIGIMEKIRNF